MNQYIATLLSTYLETTVHSNKISGQILDKPASHNTNAEIISDDIITRQLILLVYNQEE